MKKIFIFYILISNFIGLSQNLNLKPIPFSETIHNRTIEDDFRYLENTKDSTIQNWYRTNSQYTKGILNSITGRNELINQFNEFDKRKSGFFFCPLLW